MDIDKMELALADVSQVLRDYNKCRGGISVHEAILRIQLIIHELEESDVND